MICPICKVLLVKEGYSYLYNCETDTGNMLRHLSIDHSVMSQDVLGETVGGSWDEAGLVLAQRLLHSSLEDLVALAMIRSTGA